MESPLGELPGGSGAGIEPPTPREPCVRPSPEAGPEWLPCTPGVTVSSGTYTPCAPAWGVLRDCDHPRSLRSPTTGHHKSKEHTEDTRAPWGRRQILGTSHCGRRHAIQNKGETMATRILHRAEAMTGVGSPLASGGHTQPTGERVPSADLATERAPGCSGPVQGTAAGLELVHRAFVCDPVAGETP